MDGDVFGAMSSAEVQQEGTQQDNNEGGEQAWKEGDEVPEAVKNHPAFKHLETKHKELGSNLKNQGDIIAEKDKKLKEFLKTAPVPSEKLPWKPEDLRTSKELTDDEKDEMTAGELKLWDERAAMRAKENKAAEEAARKELLGENEENTEERVKGDDLKTLIATEIGALSGGDAERLRELTEAVALLNLSGLTAEQVKERVKMAERLLPNYTPPKEQAKGQGGAVKNGGEADPFNVTKIIEESRGGNKGDYSL